MHHSRLQLHGAYISFSFLLRSSNNMQTALLVFDFPTQFVALKDEVAAQNIG
jgi:hypothetical protein